MKTILIAGGTGFIGAALTNHLLGNGYRVHLLTRSNPKPHKNIFYYKWDIEKMYIDPAAFENVDTIINLTGTSIGEKRWTEKRKREIIISRTASTSLLYEYVAAHQMPINTFIAASAVGYYGSKTSETFLTEASTSGNDFVASVCKQWEASSKLFENPGCRVVIFRLGVVMGSNGGIVKKLAPLAKWGINVALGSGTQFLPWISIHDVARLYEFAITEPELRGVFNAVTDECITMNDFSKALLHSFGKSSLLPNVPAFIIKLMYGEMSAMLLTGSRVRNDKLKAWGFKFSENNIEKALDGYGMGTSMAYVQGNDT